MEQIKEKVKEKIDEIAKEGITAENLTALGKLIDIHKDIENEEYWKVKKEVYKNDVR